MEEKKVTLEEVLKQEGHMRMAPEEEFKTEPTTLPFEPAVGFPIKDIDGPEWRRVVVLRNGEWIQISYMAVQPGDIYKLYEPTGQRIVSDAGYGVFASLNGAYYDKDNTQWKNDSIGVRGIE